MTPQMINLTLLKTLPLNEMINPLYSTIRASALQPFNTSTLRYPSMYINLPREYISQPSDDSKYLAPEITVRARKSSTLPSGSMNKS